MPVLGAVLLLRPDATGESVLADPRLLAGRREGDEVPVAIESSSRAEERDLLDQLLASPDVLDVRIVFADFSDVTEVTA
jgi:hypothetical protein